MGIPIYSENQLVCDTPTDGHTCENTFKKNSFGFARAPTEVNENKKPTKTAGEKEAKPKRNSKEAKGKGNAKGKNENMKKKNA